MAKTIGKVLRLKVINSDPEDIVLLLERFAGGNITFIKGDMGGSAILADFEEFMKTLVKINGNVGISKGDKFKVIITKEVAKK